MKRIGWVLAGCVVLWSGWWVTGATVAERVIEAWLAERRAEGWAADAASVETTGYPSRFVTALEGLQLADPDTGVAWQAPDVLISRPAMAPTDLTVTFPAEQTVASPEERINVTSAGAVARLSVAPRSDLRLRESTIALEAVSLESNRGWKASVAQADIRTTATDTPMTHSIRADLTDVAPGSPILRVLDPAEVLPETLARLSVNATVTFDRDWDIRALEERRPQPRQVELQQMEIIWGAAELRVTGAFNVNEAGVPEGDIAVQVVNWRDVLELLQSNGALPEQLNALALSALEALAQASGRPDTLDAPLTLSRGLVRFGPIPLGPAPRMILR